MSELKPRCYQRAALAAIVDRFAEGYRTALAIMATGTGKTIVFAHMGHAMLAKGRVMVLAHREELIRQAARKFRAVTGVIPAIEKADEAVNEDCLHGKPQVVIASIQTLNASWRAGRKRMEKFDPAEFSLLVVDEGHHALAATWRAVIDYFLAGNPDLKVLVVTATPDRADGENLGGLCDCIAYSYDLPDAIRDGYLVKPIQRYVVIEGLDFSKVGTRAGDLAQDDLEAVMIAEKPLHGVVHAAIEVACGLENGALAKIKDRPDRAEVLARMMVGKRRRKTLVFAVSVAHADRMAEIFNRWIPESAAHVSGATKPIERAHTLRDFSRGKFQFLTNCQLATEGYDEPGIECIVMARPTKSRPLYAQMVGRGTRPDEATAAVLNTVETADERRAMVAASAKPNCIVLDFVGNAGKHKLVSSFDLCVPLDVDAAVLDRAKELAQEQGDGADVADTVAEAEAEIEEARAVERLRVEMNEELAQEMDAAREAERQREAARRLGLVGTTNYTMRDVDGFDRHATAPERETPLQRGGASDKQVNLLVGLGVQRKTAAAYGARQASAVIESLKAKRCTDRQAYALKRNGYGEAEVAGMNYDAAHAALDAIYQREEVTA
jgi:superfamily II DNA or RNA helicase